MAEDMVGEEDGVVGEEDMGEDGAAEAGVDEDMVAGDIGVDVSPVIPHSRDTSSLST